MNPNYQQLHTALWGRYINISNLFPDFDALPYPNRRNPIPAAAAADSYFAKYGVGNNLVGVDRPYERMLGYEQLFFMLMQRNPRKFRAIHKGTPYYFLGWTAFQIENFEKGIFYIDQAISEDIRKSPGQGINILRRNPAIGMLLLDGQPQSGIQIAKNILTTVRKEIRRFSKENPHTITKNNFVNKFIISNFFDPQFRTIVTSLYSFILEYQFLKKQLKFRSVTGGTLEPFFLHLFKGGLILESLLKMKNPATTPHNSLGKILDIDYRTAGNPLMIDSSQRTLRGGTLQNVITHFNSLRTSGTTNQNICFAAAYGIRNTTGHNLAWTDIFQNDHRIYSRLYSAILGSILWTIFKMWIE